MASRQQILDMLTCGGLAGESGHSISRLERWVRFYCLPEHPDAFHISDKARLGIGRILSESIGAVRAVEQMDVQRARDIALAYIERASVESTRKRIEKQARQSARIQHHYTPPDPTFRKAPKPDLTAEEHRKWKSWVESHAMSPRQDRQGNSRNATEANREPRQPARKLAAVRRPPVALKPETFVETSGLHASRSAGRDLSQKPTDLCGPPSSHVVDGLGVSNVPATRAAAASSPVGDGEVKEPSSGLGTINVP